MSRSYTLRSNTSKEHSIIDLEMEKTLRKNKRKKNR